MLTYMYKLHMIENNNSSHYVYYYVHEKWRICVNLQWRLAVVAGEYASTSSVFWAILSVIYENELLWSNHCAVLWKSCDTLE